MRKNCPQNQSHKGAEKPTSPRLTLRFQSIKSKDEKTSAGGSSKTNDVCSSQPKYQTYCVTMETRDVYEFHKDDSVPQSSNNLPPPSVNENCESKGQPPDAVTSSKDVEPSAEKQNENDVSDTDGVVSTQSADCVQKVNGRSGDVASSEYDYCSDEEKSENCSKRRKSSDCSSASVSLGGGTFQRSQRVQGSKPSQSENQPEQKNSPKSRKKGNLSSSDTETTQSDTECDTASKSEPPVLDCVANLTQNGSPPSGNGPHSPKVPPIKIVIPLSLETEARERKVSTLKQALPYVVSTEQVDTTTADTSLNSATSTQPDVVKSSEASLRCKEDQSHHAASEERFHRVTRSSHRMALANAGCVSSNANSGNESASNSTPVPSSSSGQKSEQSGESSTDEHNLNQTELHPRKRKLRTRENPDPNLTSSCQAMASSASSSSSVCDEQQAQASNSYQMYFNIRKQVDKRRKAMFVVHPKPPQGYKDYLLNRCSYVLEGNAASRISVPMIPPPQSLAGCMRDLFVQQEKERYKLRLQHLIEREKLVLSAEQEILRVHGRAARAMANQAVPLSVCTILKDEEIYNILELEQESSYVLRKKALKTRGQWNGSAIELSDDKDKNVRSRYNGRLFLSWLQDVDDKWEKIKEAMLLRHHNEAESLHAVQKLDWEWKLKELTMCDVRTTPVIDDIYVPMVHVSDDFDLLPA